MMGYGKRVLVADDEESVGRLLVGQLELHYFAAVAVADGLQALRELHQRHFDAVITDLQMPYLDGLDLLRQCHLVWPQLPVILMSGNLLGTVRPATAQGAFACLSKPVDTEQLVHVLSEATHTGEQSLARRRPPTASVLRSSGIDRLQAGSTVETSRTT